MTLILPQPTDTTKSKSHSKLHRVFAIDSNASDQTVVANANNSITVNSTVLANSFVGNLIGNASTVTNGVYKNTNNTFTGTNTFTGSVVVSDATANTNPVALGQFPSSRGVNGWTELPNGLILQWCKGVTDPANSTEPSQTITFPKEFPNACLSVSVSCELTTITGNADSWYNHGIPTKTNVVIQRQCVTSAGQYNGSTTTPTIFAIGY